MVRSSTATAGTHRRTTSTNCATEFGDQITRETPARCRRFLFSFPSLRTNGSRERAPGDRLREAIHGAAMRIGGLLRRFRLRSLSYGGQVARRNDEYSALASLPWRAYHVSLLTPTNLISHVAE